MDEEKEKRETMEVVDTSDQPAEGGPVVEESVREHEARMNFGQDELSTLFEESEADKFRARWMTIQGKFVDDPHDSVEQADDLVEDVIESITDTFAKRRDALEKAWSGGETSTVELRLALQQYRSFFERLLAIKS
jgi:hypothetical protein